MNINRNHFQMNKRHPHSISAKSLFVALLFAAAMTMLSGCSETITVDDYISVSFNGFDGYGIAEASVDYDRLVSDNEKVFKEERDILAFEMLFCGSLDTDSSLSNGDKVTFKWVKAENEIDTLEKNLKVKFQYSDKEFTVEGLKDPSSLKQLDPFEKLEVTFTGESGNAFIGLKDGNEVSGIRFSADKTNGLCNGDTVTVTAQFDVLTLMEKGYNITETTKEYTVSGLEEVVSKLSALTQDIIDRMDSEARDKMKSIAAKEWAAGSAALKNMELVNEYLLVRKEGYYGSANLYYLIYRIDAENDMDGNVSYYWYAGFRDIKKVEDTCTVNLSYPTVPNGSYILGSSFGTVYRASEDSKYYYVGYESEDKIRYDIIDQNAAEYTSETRH